MCRNIWKDCEIITLLEIFREQNVVNLIEEKRLKNPEIYKMVEQEMILRGVETKTAEQIKTKWKALKSAYNRAKKNNTVTDCAESEYFKFLDEILENRAPSTIKLNNSYELPPELPLEIKIEESEPKIQEFLSPPTSEEETPRKVIYKKKRLRESEDSNFFKQQEQLMDEFFKRQMLAEEKASERRSQELKMMLDTFSASISSIVKSLTPTPVLPQMSGNLDFSSMPFSAASNSGWIQPEPSENQDQDVPPPKIKKENL